MLTGRRTNWLKMEWLLQIPLAFTRNLENLVRIHKYMGKDKKIQISFYWNKYELFVLYYFVFLFTLFMFNVRLFILRSTWYKLQLIRNDMAKPITIKFSLKSNRNCNNIINVHTKLYISRQDLKTKLLPSW